MEIKKVELLNKQGLQKQLSIGSGCVIIKDNKVLLVRGKGGTHFKFPGGHILDSENFKESAEREAQEEIGCTVIATGDPVFYMFNFNETTDILLIHYKGNITDGEPKPTTEIEEVKWFDLNNIPQEVFDNVLPVLAKLR